MGFLPWDIQVAFPGESQQRQSRATQLRVHVECFSVSIIHRTLPWTTGSLTSAQMRLHTGVYGHRKRESALKVDFGRKIPRRNWESNPRRRRTGLML